MCVYKLKILNRSNSQIAGLTPKVYSVSCGKCWQCQQARRDGYFVRNFYEFLQAKYYGGFSLFITCTYSSECLPKVGNVPVFCKSDVQKYFKRLRITLIRRIAKNFGISQKDASAWVSNNIRYFCSSENGEKRHRPHYHILIYCLSSKISKWLVRKLACECWKYGYAVPSAENFGFIDSVKGIKYVTKYVGKSITDNTYFGQILESARQQYVENLNKPHEKEFFVKYQKLRENKPFLLSSKGLGLFALSDACDPQYRLTADSFFSGSVLVADDNQVVKDKPLPQYYRRKFCFDVHTEKITDVTGVAKYHITYTRNQFGIDVMNHQYKQMFDNFDKNLSVALTYPFVNVPEFVKSVQNIFGKGLTFEYIKEFLARYTKENSFKEFALLYSSYVPFLSDDELNAHYHNIPFSDVVSFRSHVNCSDDSNITYHNIDDYQEFYYKILENIFYYHKKFPHYRMCLVIYEMLLEHINKHKTMQQTRRDVIANHHRILNEV